MARRTASQIFSDLLGAGFSAASATIMTAIALAESGGDPAAVGDVGLQDSTWGPSYGLYQIRTVKRDTGSGGARDIASLVDPAFQARSAYAISGSGANFTPWSVYTSGAYQSFLGQAQQAAGDLAPWDLAGDSGPLPILGPAWAPWNIPGRVGNAAAGQVGEVLAGGRSVAIEASFIGLGLVLVVAGLARAWMMSPPQRRARAQAATAVKAVL